MNMQYQIKLIRDFVNKQSSLIDMAISGFGESIDDLNFKNAVPKNVIVNSEYWNVLPHGVGLRFECQSTGEVIDAHAGFLDMPNAFDAWRLEEYCISLGIVFKSNESWEIVLRNLHDSGDILVTERPRHFTLNAVRRTP